MTARLQVVQLPNDEYLLVLDQVAEDDSAVLSGQPWDVSNMGARGFLVFPFRVDCVVPDAG